MKQLGKTRRFLLSDLEENGAQCSLDPEADLRFAHFLKDNMSEKFIQDNLDKGIRLSLRKVADKRLRVLNGLIKLKLVKAGWVGTKYGGTKHVGVNRVRIYMLSTAVNIVSVQTVRNDIITKIRSPKKVENE
jgi:predicted DNA-binding transcriptional regulator